MPPLKIGARKGLPASVIRRSAVSARELEAFTEAFEHPERHAAHKAISVE